MGKKKITTQSEEETLKESETLEKNISKVSDKVIASKKIDIGKVYINATYNNTLITATNKNGDVLAWVSAGGLGFSGPKKATPFASSKAVAALAEKLKKVGLRNIDVIVKGVGSGRDSAIRSLSNQGFNILSLRDMTGIPHNGPKPKKARRI
ncbi:30S ribosomal protein S11 [Candidatus Wolfebacteria bacterium CG10_big_fil_rev_8_21_14_0_10_31_9]|uniref:Small ribosomal subunit protein uS11 n=1 Tax=Candidatus Wolfebacteria bacterium CG10_big_fil_rev_8_21_14_0_10_31_9 TaxID=1975070 RepID=A0A2H0RBW3_9BACT|nr:MAG: 30S ribosomal protein S11 [Candidatus Wolfebacteria bacterium CG10_big_fil_rev_8_21_14_0_10_31_9]